MVNIDSQGHVVTNEGGNFKMNTVAHKIRIRFPLELPVICKEEIKIEKKIIKRLS